MPVAHTLKNTVKIDEYSVIVAAPLSVMSGGRAETRELMPT